MVCGIIWENRVALRGEKAAVGCKKLAIVTMKRYVIKIQIEDHQAKLSLLKGSYLFKSRIGEQQS